MKVRDVALPVAGSGRWEHRSVRMEPDAPLDQYSGEGWELVAVIPDVRDPGMVIAYFKRRRG